MTIWTLLDVIYASGKTRFRKTPDDGKLAPTTRKTPSQQQKSPFQPDFEIKTPFKSTRFLLEDKKHTLEKFTKQFNVANFARQRSSAITANKDAYSLNAVNRL